MMGLSCYIYIAIPARNHDTSTIQHGQSASSDTDKHTRFYLRSPSVSIMGVDCLNCIPLSSCTPCTQRTAFAVIDPPSPPTTRCTMSSFPLPPISTLSSVLDADDSPLAIAPELMGEEGAPPVRNNEQHPKDVLNHNNANSHSLPGHESLDPHESEYLDDTRQRVDSWSESAGFNARMGNAVDDQDGNLQPWGMYPDDSKPSNTTFGDHPPLSQPDLNSQRGQNHLDVPADQSNDDGLGQPSTSTENPRPKKRSRTNTKRASLPNPEITDPSGLDDTQLAEAEYEDPSRDWRLGPVFVQPPKGTAQACVRCHRIKRKCDGGRPRCAGCAKADVACVFELSPATSRCVRV